MYVEKVSKYRHVTDLQNFANRPFLFHSTKYTYTQIVCGSNIFATTVKSTKKVMGIVGYIKNTKTHKKYV